MLRKPYFFYLSQAILALFMGIIVYVIVIAYGRKTGSTGLDMATLQKMRFEAVQKEIKLTKTDRP